MPRAVGGDESHLLAGDHFGELAPVDGAPRAATVSAAGEVTAARMGRKEFRKLPQSEPALGAGPLEGLVATIGDLEPARA